MPRFDAGNALKYFFNFGLPILAGFGLYQNIPDSIGPLEVNSSLRSVLSILGGGAAFIAVSTPFFISEGIRRYREPLQDNEGRIIRESREPTHNRISRSRYL